MGAGTLFHETPAPDWAQRAPRGQGVNALDLPGPTDRA